MKLIDIMKTYSKAVMRENAKLKSIYNQLIKESEIKTECDDTLNEFDGTNDAIVDFFDTGSSKTTKVEPDTEALDEETKEALDEETVETDTEAIDETDLIPLSKFKEDYNEGEETLTAESFFGITTEKQEETVLSKEDFLNASLDEKETKDVETDTETLDEKETKDVETDTETLDEKETKDVETDTETLDEKEAVETDTETLDDDTLEENIKEYYKKNRRLFDK